MGRLEGRGLRVHSHAPRPRQEQGNGPVARSFRHAMSMRPGREVDPGSFFGVNPVNPGGQSWRSILDTRHNPGHPHPGGQSWTPTSRGVNPGHPHPESGREV